MRLYAAGKSLRTLYVSFYMLMIHHFSRRRSLLSTAPTWRPNLNLRHSSTPITSRTHWHSISPPSRRNGEMVWYRCMLNSWLIRCVLCLYSALSVFTHAVRTAAAQAPLLPLPIPTVWPRLLVRRCRSAPTMTRVLRSHRKRCQSQIQLHRPGGRSSETMTTAVLSLVGRERNGTYHSYYQLISPSLMPRYSRVSFPESEVPLNPPSSSICKSSAVISCHI